MNKVVILKAKFIPLITNQEFNSTHEDSDRLRV